MNEIVDMSEFEYVPISESCVLARGAKQDAILDLKTHKAYGLKKWAGNLLVWSHRLPIVANLFEGLLYKIDRFEQRAQQYTKIIDGNRRDILRSQDLTLPPEHLQHICIEMTDACNLDCIFCSKETWFVGRSIGCRRSPAKDKTTPLNVDQWKKVLKDARALGCSSLRLQGGEPLMNPEMTLNLIRYSHDLGFGRIQLWTNGILLTPEIVDSLQLLDVDLAIQAFSLQSEDHETITGNKNTFETLMDNLAYVAVSWIPFLVVIPRCSTRQTEQDVENLISFVEDLGRHDARIFRQNVHVQIPLLEKDDNGPHSVTVNWAGDVFSCSTERLDRIGNVCVTPLREIFDRERLEQQVEPLSPNQFRDDCELDKDIPTGDQFLIHLTRPILVRKVINQIQDWDLNDVDWDVFLRQAGQHQVAGLIYHSALTHQLPLPSKVISRLYWDVVRYKRQAHDLFHVLEEISRVLSGIDGPVLLFNEPLLIMNMYRSLLLRKFEQIDLTLHHEHVNAAKACLNGLGYVEETDAQVEGLTLRRSPDACFWGLNRHRMIRQNTGFVVDIYSSDMCHVDFCQMIKDSKLDATFGSGLRVPLVEDQILLAVYAFYKRHGFNDQYIGQLARASHQKGFLLNLADVYTSMRAYLSQQAWSRLISRARDIGLTEILFYTLGYINLFYGKGTIPEEVLHELQGDSVIHSPVAGYVEDFLQSEIETASSVIAPSLWILRPWEAYQQVIADVRAWKKEGKPYPTVVCHRVAKSNNEEPSNEDWNNTDYFLVTETEVDSRQFFKTHVTSGNKLEKDCGNAQIRVLWDDENFYARMRVSTSNRFSMCGEQIVLYFSDTSDDRLPVKRLGVAIGENGGLKPVPFYFERSLGEATAQNVAFDDFRINAEIFKAHYELHIAVPWRTLNIVPQIDFRLGFDIEMYHQTMNVETVSAWAGGQGLSLLNPAVHGVMILTG